MKKAILITFIILSSNLLSCSDAQTNPKIFMGFQLPMTQSHFINSWDSLVKTGHASLSSNGYPYVTAGFINGRTEYYASSIPTSRLGESNITGLQIIYYDNYNQVATVHDMFRNGNKTHHIKYPTVKLMFEDICKQLVSSYGNPISTDTVPVFTLSNTMYCIKRWVIEDKIKAQLEAALPIEENGVTNMSRYQVNLSYQLVKEEKNSIY